MQYIPQDDIYIDESVADRRTVLANFLNVSPIELTGRGNYYRLEDQEFAVYTDEQAEAIAREQVLISLNQLPNDILLSVAKDGVDVRVIEDLKALGDEGWAGIKALIQDFDALYRQVLDLQGRGYFLAADGEESEEHNLYIYRLN